MSRIAVIGAGSFGARHVQGLARIDRPLHVDVVDPSEAARTRAMSLLAEAGGLRHGTCVMHADLSALREAPDLAIVATAARERPRAVRDAVSVGARRMILEKVLFTRLADFDDASDLFQRRGLQVWVNCTRRAYPRAIELKQLVAGKPVAYTVSGAGWGLASNVIHHLDEFSMLCGTVDIEVSAEALCPAFTEAKRLGYIEFFGSLRGRTPDGSVFTAVCTEGTEAIPGDREIVIETDDVRIELRQSRDTMYVVQSGQRHSRPYPAPLQSELTAPVVTSILDGAPPCLPDYNTAAAIHRVLIGTLLGHMRRSTGNPDLNEVPIT
jgi:predicted dehydrogenase